MKTITRHASIVIVLCIIAAAFFVSVLLMPFIYIASTDSQIESEVSLGIVDVQGHRFRTFIGKGASTAGVTHLLELDVDRGLMISRTDFDADSHPVVTYRVLGGHPGIIGYLVWRTGGESQQTYRAPINLNTSGPTYIDMSSNENWTGIVKELGLDVYGDLRNQPFSLQSIQAGGLTYITIMGILCSDWLTFKPWDHSSINSLKWLYKNPATSPIVLAALWVLIALICLVTLRVAGIRAASYSFLAVILIPWVALDLLWQLQLSRQAWETSSTFSGLTPVEKQEVVDASLYEYAQHLKDKVLSSPDGRVFIVHRSWGHNYNRLRLQYLLLPANIYNFGVTLPDPNHVRPGDYILLLGEIKGALYAEAERELKQGSRVLNAVQVDEHPLGKTYRASRGPLSDQ